MHTGDSRVAGTGRVFERQWPIILTLVAVILVACSLFLYAFPRADECYRAGTARDCGLTKAMLAEYTGWSGRWAGTGLVYLIGSTLPLEASYRCLLLVIQLVTFSGVYAVLGAAFSAQDLSRRNRLLLTLGLFALYWTGLPSLSDGFYWLTGSIENELSIGMSLLIVAAVARTPGKLRWSLMIRQAGIGLMALVAVGMHELFGVGLAVVMVAGTLLAWMSGHQTRWSWLVITLFTVTGLAIALAAPGNGVRMGIIRPDHSLASLLYYCKIWGTILAGWVMDPKFITATFLLLALPRFGTLQPIWLCERPMVWNVGVVSCFVTVLAALIIGPWWPLGCVPPGRTRSGIYLVFLIGWMVVLFVLHRPRIATTSQPFGLPLPSRAFLGLYFAVCLATLGNFPVAVRDLYCTARTYKHAMKHRYEVIRAAQARGEQNLLLSPLPVVPVCFDYDADLVELDSKAANKYVNQHYALYFGFQSIALRKLDGSR